MLQNARHSLGGTWAEERRGGVRRSRTLGLTPLTADLYVEVSGQDRSCVQCNTVVSTIALKDANGIQEVCS